MGNSKPEEKNIIKDLKNLFRLEKELNYTAIKDYLKDNYLKDIINNLEINNLALEKLN